MRRLTLLILAVAAAPSAHAQRTVPRDRSFRMTAQAGQELRVGTFASWSRDCSAEPAPQIIVGTPPAHGTLSIRPGHSTVSIIRQGAADCTGRSYPGTSVWYLPAPGFRGEDRFDYTVQNVRTSGHDRVTVEVQ